MMIATKNRCRKNDNNAMINDCGSVLCCLSLSDLELCNYIVVHEIEFIQNLLKFGTIIVPICFRRYGTAVVL